MIITISLRYASRQTDVQTLASLAWRRDDASVKLFSFFIPNQLLKLDWKTCWNPQLFLENALGQPREINWKCPHRIEGDGVWVEQKQIFRGTFAETLELWDFPFDVQVSLT